MFHFLIGMMPTQSIVNGYLQTQRMEKIAQIQRDCLNILWPNRRSFLEEDISTFLTARTEPKFIPSLMMELLQAWTMNCMADALQCDLQKK